MIDLVKTTETSTSPEKIEKTADCVTRCGLLKNTEYFFSDTFQYANIVPSYRISPTHSVYTLLGNFLQTQLHPRRYREKKNYKNHVN